MTPEEKINAKKFATTSKDPLNILDKIYSKPDELTENNNSWLLKTNILYGLIILVIILTLLITLIYVCKINNFPVFEILKENIAVFIGVGVIEVLFFLNIGLKFIPTKPSIIITNTITDLKQNL